MRLTDRDFDIVARTVYGEARGESYDGKVAVVWVIKNRALYPSWWGKTPADVCLKDKQFSCWDVPRLRAEMLQATMASLSFDDCLRATLEAFKQSHHYDPTLGADHYHARYVAPPWAEGKNPTAEIGAHLFYRLEAPEPRWLNA